MKAEDENEAMRDALDHIIRTCDAAQNQTRRLLWIRERASCALNDSAAWKELDLPPNRARQNENRRIRDADTITALQAERDALRADAEKKGDALHKIEQWGRAYPQTVFVPLTDAEWKKANEVLAAAGLSLTAISGDNMRHVITQVSGIAAAALTLSDTPTDE